MAQFIRLARLVTFTAIQRIAFESLSMHAQRLGVRTTVYIIIVANIGALALIATSCLGDFCVDACRTACPAVIGIVAIDVDTYFLSVFCT